MRIESRLSRQWMVHERDDLQPRSFARHLFRQRSEREPIDEDGGPVRNRGEHAGRVPASSEDDQQRHSNWVIW